MVAMIEANDVHKHYGDVRAVDGVSFTIAAGEIVGFLGPNGAGKSTLLKMISTWLAPTSGTIRVAGHDVTRDSLAVRRSLGYLTEHNALYEGMRVLAFLRFVATVRGLTGQRRDERIAWVVARCSLEAVLGKWVAECSKGYRQRVGLAAALIHDPPVILLDEPTHGLDPLQVVEFREFLRSLRVGRAILFSSHVLAEVLSISDRVLLIHRGRLLEDSAVGDLRRRAASKDGDVEELLLERVRDAEMAAGGAR
jgi:ABC-2 type transport system ATP-binding protein